jgi:hypothetical protein
MVSVEGRKRVGAGVRRARARRNWRSRPGHHPRRLSPETARQIREALLAASPVWELALNFKISKASVYDVAAGRTWKQAGGPSLEDIIAANERPKNAYAALLALLKAAVNSTEPMPLIARALHIAERFV